ncbi:MAG: hypothetical protein HYT49_01335 [Candidatus Wildermuthbacteria bacterium]|nr:hypothetical protein [Candidatus Wildermuthbacteria bacterium]
MKDNFEQFIRKARQVRFSQEDKARTHELLSRYMRMNPARFRAEGRHQVQRSPFFQEFIKNCKFLYKPMMALAVLVVTVMAGGGVSLAAENALPGDVLYPVKVEVNEEFRAMLAFSQEAKAEWKVQQTGRRLQEAEKLAAKGEFGSETAAKVDAKFEQHTQKLSEIASKLEAKGNVEAAAAIHSSLEATLEAHERILGALRGEADGRVEEILVKVKVKTREAREARDRAEAEVSAKAHTEVKEAAEGKLGAAQNKIAEVKSFIAKMEARAGAAATADAKARLEAADNTLAQGKTRLEADACGEAFVLFQQAMRTAQEAKSLVQGSIDIELDLDDEDEENEQELEEEHPPADGEIEVETEIETEVELETDNEREERGRSGTQIEVEL